MKNFPSLSAIKYPTVGRVGNTASESNTLAENSFFHFPISFVSFASHSLNPFFAWNIPSFPQVTLDTLCLPAAPFV